MLIIHQLLGCNLTCVPRSQTVCFILLYLIHGICWWAAIEAVMASDKGTDASSATIGKGLRGKLNKVVLAYSGGLDTSVIVPWLRYHPTYFTFLSTKSKQSFWNCFKSMLYGYGVFLSFHKMKKIRFIIIWYMYIRLHIVQTNSTAICELVKIRILIVFLCLIHRFSTMNILFSFSNL